MNLMDRVEILRHDLQNPPAAKQEYLVHLLNVAESEILEEGIHLSESVGDENLRIMYAAYLYRKRVNGENGMPRMLRYALNNRLFKEKGAVANDS